MAKVLDIMRMVKFHIMEHFLKIRKKDMDYIIMKVGILNIMEPGIKMLFMEWAYYIMKLENFLYGRMGSFFKKWKRYFI